MTNSGDATGSGASVAPRSGGKTSRRVALVTAVVLVGCGIAGGAIYYGVYRLENWHVVAPGKLHRSAQPTPRQFWNFSRLGYNRVISLRGYHRAPELLTQEEAACAAAGIEFIHIPINARLPSHEQIRQFLDAVETSAGPVLVHCEHGKSRAGMMSAAHRVVVQDWSVERAMKDEFVRRFPTVKEESRELVTDLIRGYLAASSHSQPPVAMPVGG